MKRTAALIAFLLFLFAAGAAWAAEQVIEANPSPQAVSALPVTPGMSSTQTVAPPPPLKEPAFPNTVTANTDWRTYVDNLFTPQGAYFPAVDENDYKGRPGDKGNWRDYYLADKPYVPGVGWPRRVPYLEARVPPCPPHRPPYCDRYYYYPVYYYPPPPPPPVIIIINNNVYY